jgi:hypothetical protein
MKKIVKIRDVLVMRTTKVGLTMVISIMIMLLIHVMLIVIMMLMLSLISIMNVHVLTDIKDLMCLVNFIMIQLMTIVIEIVLMLNLVHHGDHYAQMMEKIKLTAIVLHSVNVMLDIPGRTVLTTTNITKHCTNTVSAV